MNQPQRSRRRTTRSKQKALKRGGDFTLGVVVLEPGGRGDEAKGVGGGRCRFLAVVCLKDLRDAPEGEGKAKAFGLVCVGVGVQKPLEKEAVRVAWSVTVR